MDYLKFLFHCVCYPFASGIWRHNSSLPATWKGYWAVEGTSDSAAADPHQGPSITLINPQSTSEKEYQDIYTMCSATLNGNRFSGEISLSARHPWGQGNLAQP